MNTYELTNEPLSEQIDTVKYLYCAAATDGECPNMLIIAQNFPAEHRQELEEFALTHLEMSPWPTTEEIRNLPPLTPEQEAMFDRAAKRAIERALLEGLLEYKGD